MLKSLHGDDLADVPMAMNLSAAAILPYDHAQAALLARYWDPAVDGPCVAAIRDGAVHDVTSKRHPTAASICETGDPAAALNSLRGPKIGSAADLLANSGESKRDPAKPWFLSPIDLQAVKAAGVTFAQSMIERVIEEQARGAPEKAAAIRADISRIIGEDLSKLKPGSPDAMRLKAALIEKGAWSQYLEVGIGPDAEIFTKAPVLASVGTGADVGIHPISSWSNPEPEIVAVAQSSGRIVGAALGNDVNLRDVEGRSALLLGKAKDNNASAAIGPFIRLFDASFSLDDVRAAEVSLSVRGEDGFAMEGSSSMRRISRDPADLVAAMMGQHHQYPDGAALYLGTMFAPVKDRGAPGKGFTHIPGDTVTVATPKLGALVNRVRLTDQCAPWTFGIAALMKNLSARGLL
jgi:fumarylacetoacetate (FAA) hydrolase family protein